MSLEFLKKMSLKNHYNEMNEENINEAIKNNCPEDIKFFNEIKEKTKYINQYTSNDLNYWVSTLSHDEISILYDVVKHHIMI